MTPPTSSDEERETLIAEAERYIRNWDGDYVQRGVDEVRRLAAALKAQRPVREAQVEALEQAVADCPDMSGFTRAWFRERAAELRRSGALAHSHAPDTGMWAGCQACTAGGGG